MYPAIQRMVNELKHPVIKDDPAQKPNNHPGVKLGGAFSPLPASGNTSSSSSSVNSPSAPPQQPPTPPPAVAPAPPLAQSSSNAPPLAIPSLQTYPFPLGSVQRPSTPAASSAPATPASPATTEGANDYFGSRGFEPYAASIIPEHLGSLSTPSYLYPPAAPGMPPFGMMPATALGEVEAQLYDPGAYWSPMSSM